MDRECDREELVIDLGAIVEETKGPGLVITDLIGGEIFGAGLSDD